MRKLYRICILLLSLIILPVYAGGGIAHMFLAQETIDRLPDPALRNLLKNNFEAYVVGAYYPDSGFVGGNHYGEDSHWDAFIFTFADYLKDKYSQPELQNPKLVAFLFGCAAHRLSDEVMHWTFYPVMAKQDFHTDNWSEAHQYGDIGIDLLLIIDKNQWLTHPTTWWVPVKDLVAVYQRMGKPEYTAEEIIRGNSITFFAGYGERLIAAPAYPYLRWKMPWTSQHYYDWPVGGITMDEDKTAEYLMNLWQRLKGKKPFPRATLSKMHQLDSNPANHSSVLNDFSTNILNQGVVSVPTITNEDGSVELQSPIINSFTQFQQSLVNLISKIRQLN